MLEYPSLQLAILATLMVMTIFFEFLVILLKIYMYMLQKVGLFLIQLAQPLKPKAPGLGH